MWALTVLLIAGAILHLSLQQCQYNVKPDPMSNGCEITNNSLPHGDGHCATNVDFLTPNNIERGYHGTLANVTNMTSDGTAVFEVFSLNQNITIDLDWSGLTQDKGDKYNLTQIAYKDISRVDQGFLTFNYFLLNLIYNQTSECFNIEEIIYITWSDNIECFTMFQSVVIYAGGTTYVAVFFDSPFHHWKGSLEIKISTNGIMETFEEPISETHSEFYLFKIAITKINKTADDTTMQCGINFMSSDYTCHGGCPPLSNRFSETCNDDGGLADKSPMCPDIECDSIENIDDGDWHIISTSDGLQVVYNCSDGYFMKGNDTRRCVCSDNQTYNTSTGFSNRIIHGIWSGETPTCLRTITPDENCSLIQQIKACESGSGGPTLMDGTGDKIYIKTHRFFNDVLFNFTVYESGKVDFNDGALSMTVANLSNDDIHGVQYDYDMTTNYGMIQRQHLDCLLAQLQQDINVTDFFVLSWKKDFDEVIIQLAILTDSIDRTYAMFIYTDDPAAMIGDRHVGFRGDTNSSCNGEVFYNFPKLPNSTIEDDERIFIQQIDNLGKVINCTCDPDKVMVGTVVNTPTESRAKYHCNCSNNATDYYVHCINGSWDTNCKGARLTNGSSGLVETCYDNEWIYYVCDNEWDSQDANVVCGEAGYLNFGAKAITMGYNFDNRNYSLDYVQCTGQETRLFDCKPREEEPNCGNREVAGAECLSKNICITSSGAIKVKRNGEWRYVCINFWTNDDARVACNWLGFKDSDNHKIYPADVGSNGTEFWMDYVNCKGDEHTLFECLYILKLGHRAKYCYPNHKKVAGVMCSGTPPDGDDHLCE